MRRNFRYAQTASRLEHMPAKMNKNKSISKAAKPKCARCGGGHASAKCKSFKVPRNVPINEVARGALGPV